MTGHSPAKLTERSKGFTLIELLVTLAIVGIMVGTGVIGYTRWIFKTKTEEYSYSLQRSIAQARSAAIKHGGNIVLCGSTNGSQCAAQLDAGWILFFDADNSGQVDNGENVISYFQIEDPSYVVSLENTATAAAVAAFAFNYRGYSNQPITATVSRDDFVETFTMNRAGNLE